MNLIGRTNLLNDAVPHNGQTVANGHGLFLVMGDKMVVMLVTF